MTTSATTGSGPLSRHAVRRTGVPGTPPLLLVHGFGCDQTVWDGVRAVLEEHHDVYSYDLLGVGASDLGAYDPRRYSSLDAHVDDLLAVVRAIDEPRLAVVAHSLGATLAILAAVADPERFSALALIGASARYVDEDDYTGGLSRAELDDLLALLDDSWERWTAAMAPGVAGSTELGEHVRGRFLQLPAQVAGQLGALAFSADIRAEARRVEVPTLLVQASDDVVVPTAAAAWLHRNLPGSELVQLRATGHLPHLSDPEETARAVLSFLARHAEAD